MAKSKPALKGFSDFANIPDKVLMLPTPENIIRVDGTLYRQTISDIFAGVYDDMSVEEVLEDLDKRYNEAFKKLPQTVRDEYRQPAEIISNFKRDK